MKLSYLERHADALKKILKALPSRAKGQEKAFVEQFYDKVTVADLEKFDPAKASAVALGAYEFFQDCPKGKPAIRAFTPTQEKHGWQTHHLVVELLNDDMPFLVDSLTAEFIRLGLNVYETIHPIYYVERSSKGALKEIHAPVSGKGSKESFIHFEVSVLPEELSEAQLIEHLQRVLMHVRATYEDWRPILAKVEEATQHLEPAPKDIDIDEVNETRDFLKWLSDNHFVFLGYVEYDFYDAKGNEALIVVEGSRLGVLKVDDDAEPRGLEALPPESRHFLLVPQLVEITKSNRKSTVHRPVHMDYIGIKRFDASGKVIGERRFLGLFTSTVYYQSAQNIPIIRRKITQVMERAGFESISHDSKALKTILEFLPRDEVFQIGVSDLFDAAMGILSLEARPAVRVFVRKDAFERFVSCMVFVPREHFSTRVRYLIQDILEKTYQATVSVFYTQIGESPLARLHLILKTTPGSIPNVSAATVEAEVAKVSYQWIDLLQAEMLPRYGEHKTSSLIRAYGAAFPEGYVSRYSTSQAIFDIEKIIETQQSSALSLEFYRQDEGLHLKIYSPTEGIALSDILPMLENAGLRVIDEYPFFIQPRDGSVSVWIRDFKLTARLPEEVPFEELKEKFEGSLVRVWRHEVENDRFNALVLYANLTWRQVEVLRAYAHYLKQIAYAYTPQAIEQALAAHPQLTGLLVKLFETRFDPANESNREQNEQHLIQQINEGLSEVSSVAEDRIIRRYVELIRATQRCNYFQCDNGKSRPILSFKFDSAKVPELPLPRPYAEIYVYSPRIEGIHLRGGKVARGGLRWSDRFEDFRTEVLGLMKAQMVKNSVIVPVGSKGGFVVKNPPEDGGRDAMQAEGVACYRLFLQGMLDLTDNIVEGRVTPPREVVRHDGDDPYLVVAADKGTATFSDIANEVSRDYGFWLDDAFASGGSAGYDHKKMGITARGAWVSVERHFSEMGVNIDREPFTVAGIGDMSGDVFGNGMLLSENIKLVAAFNHMHIFIDPDPDTKKSYEERKRVFGLPRSRWTDYDASLISKGGGIYERSAKTINVSAEAKKALDLDKDSYTPDELIRAILMAPVDLLWNGGIGTYVKASDETHEQVGDRTNNALRVNGNQLRCKIVGEGGNLGFTQKGRIEYAWAGGRINTDAIDNSAGVDCSDHEVNIKIAFSQALQSNELTRQKRDTILAGMTEEVASLVLKDNILQTQALTIAQHQGAKLVESQQHLMQVLEHQGMLDREIEFLPSNKQLTELRLASKGLSRPSLAVLLAYAKLWLYRDIVESDLPDDEYFSSDLVRYFPRTMQESFDECIEGHPLRREIIATVVTNSLINRVGMTFYSDIALDTNMPARDIASAYTLARDAFSLRKIWSMIEQEGASISPETQSELYTTLTRFVESMTIWFLRNQPMPLSMGKIMAEFMPGIEEFCENQEVMHSRATQKAYDKQYEYWTGLGTPEDIAKFISSLEMRLSACDVISIANKSKLPIATVGKIYFELGARLHLGWLRRSAYRVPADTHWERVAAQSIVQDLYEEQRRLSTLVIDMFCQDRANPDIVEEWYQKFRIEIDRYEEFVGDLKATEAPDFSILVVALRNLKSLCAL